MAVTRTGTHTSTRLPCRWWWRIDKIVYNGSFMEESTGWQQETIDQERNVCVCLRGLMIGISQLWHYIFSRPVQDDAPGVLKIG